MACVSRLHTHPRLRAFGIIPMQEVLQRNMGMPRVLSLGPCTVQGDSTDFPKYARQNKHNWEGDDVSFWGCVEHEPNT